MILSNEIKRVPIDQLTPAPWNYKSEGTADEIKRLAASILRDESAGVPAVRLLTDGQYEVIDGNHRLSALIELGVTDVDVEDFGQISEAEAVTIARRRNHQWFDDDLGELGRLYKDVVLPEIPIDELAEFMPGGADEIQNLVDLVDVDWDNYRDSGKEEDDGDGAPDAALLGKKITVTLDADTLVVWKAWLKRVEDATGDNTREEALRLALQLVSDIDLGDARE